MLNLLDYEIKIGHDLLKKCGDWARNCLSQNTKKIALISNPKVFKLYGEIVETNLKKAGFQTFVWRMKDGERYKNLKSLEQSLAFLSENKFTRSDAIIALGGGVVGDLAGFAAAVYQRGINFLMIPTTLLSMIDSSVGGKTAVNTKHGKNLIGAFHQPEGVLIDINVLQTLERRELTAGFCEAIKQGALCGAELFNQTDEILKNYPPNNLKKHFSDEEFLAQFEKFITAQVSFKSEIVQHDEKENITRTDAKSRKILNFGHTLAHALEKVTDYKRFKHGEAVGIGILFAAQIAKELDIFDKDGLKSLNDVVHRAGKFPETSDINLETIIKAFAFDKKSTGETLHWILLEDIGKPCIVKNEDIPTTIIEKSLEKVLQN